MNDKLRFKRKFDDFDVFVNNYAELKYQFFPFFIKTKGVFLFRPFVLGYYSDDYS